MSDQHNLRQEFYAEITNDCADWLRLLANKEDTASQSLREEVGRVYAWASLQCDLSEPVT